MRKVDFEQAMDNLEDIKHLFRSTQNTGDLAPEENIIMNKLNSASIVISEMYQTQWGRYTPKQYR